MFHLPTKGHKARKLIDIASLADILNPANALKLPVTWQAVRQSITAFEADPAIRRICYVVLRADNDERWLISVGRKGGWRKEWNFGNGRA